MKHEIDDYIEDIYNLARAEFSRESIKEASRVIDYLIPAVVEWRTRKIGYCLFFFSGIAFTLIAAKLYVMFT